MNVTLDIPDDIADHLRAVHGGDLTRTTLEQFALGEYSAGNLSRYQVQRLLGFEDRWETEKWLGSAGAAIQYTQDDLQQDRASLDQLLKPSQS